MLISLLTLSFAVSLDVFGVGMTYGLRKMRIPFLSMLIISGFSSIFLLVSMQIGLWFTDFFSPRTAKMMGSFILICVGCWAIFNISKQQEHSIMDRHPLSHTVKNQPSIFPWEIKRLDMVVQILKKPAEADLDRSGTISVSEAMMLGMVSAFDAFGAGFAASLIGLKPLLTSITVGAMTYLFFLSGVKLGFICSKLQWIKRFSYIPGLLLILIGIIKLF